MSEALKTVKELADELGVSKQRIQQIIAKLPTNKTPNKDGNKFVLNKKDIYNIKVSMGLKVDKISTNQTTNRVVDYDIYMDVLNSLENKDEQINNLIESQKQTQKLLDQQQQLSLQDKQLITELRQQLALESPKEEMDTTETEEVVAEEEIISVKPTEEQVPKWWQFWK